MKTICLLLCVAVVGLSTNLFPVHSDKAAVDNRTAMEKACQERPDMLVCNMKKG
jgi:hypothetical protein